MQTIPSVFRHPLLASKERAFKAQIRWMIRSDMPAVLYVETTVDEPWGEERFYGRLRDCDIIGMVIELRDPTTGHDSIVGHMVYELGKRRLNLLRLVIDRDFRRLGLGTQLVDKLKTKLSREGKRTIRSLIPELELAVQQLLRSRGFKAIEQDNGQYEEEECYRMEYLHREDAK